MKLAHLVLAHNHPQQLKRLVTRLSSNDADVYIHLDAKADFAQYSDTIINNRVFFIKNRINVMWGEYSVIQATLNGMDEILKSGITYSHINLLSGNDYPLKKAEEIQEFFFSNSNKSYMWYGLIPEEWIHGQVRMNTYYFGEYGFPGRYFVSSLVNKIIHKRKLPNNLKAYGRAQWFTLTPECVSYVLNYIRNNKNVERFFKMSWCVDEVFFQTILCNSPLLNKIENNNYRYVVLDPKFSPITFTMANAKELANSGKFYARKFNAEIDEKIFDFLDSL